MSLTVIKSDLSGFPDPPISDESSEAVEPSFYIPSVYEGSSFSVKLSFFYEDPLLPGSNLSSIAGNCVSDFSDVGVTVTKLSTSEFLVSGSYAGVLTGSVYTFVMRDGSLKQLSPDTQEDYRALVEFTIPTQRRKDNEILFELQFDGGVTANTTILQSVHYSFRNAVNVVQSLVRSRS